MSCFPSHRVVGSCKAGGLRSGQGGGERGRCRSQQSVWDPGVPVSRGVGPTGAWDCCRLVSTVPLSTPIVLMYPSMSLYPTLYLPTYRSIYLPIYLSHHQRWNLGMVTYEMLTGLPPWYTTNREKLFQSIRTAPLKFPMSVNRTAALFIQVR